MLPTTARPSARWAFSIAYDAARQRLVLFGGFHGVCGGTCVVTVNFDETWLWDGSNWSQAAAASRPPGRVSPTMVYDPDRQRVVLAGGYVRFGSGNNFSDWPRLDSWQWNGSTWTSAAPLTFVPRHGAFDPVLRRIVLFHDEVSTLTAHANSSQSYGAGCPGGGGVPWLTSNPPLLGNASFALDHGATPANSLSLVGLALTPGNQPLGGNCNLLLGPMAVILPALANPSGFASVSIPIPALPMLRGLVVHAQALVLDPTAAGGFSMSPGLLLQVGD